MFDFEDQVALVTGAASGIGRATAVAFARAGARVVVSDLNQDAADETVSEIVVADGVAFAVVADVARPDDCARMVEQTLDTYGRLDCACNNAGIAGRQAPLAELTVDDWRAVIDVDLSSAFYCMKAEIPAMLRGGGGTIVNMSSILGTVGFAGASSYVAAKHGLVGLTQTAALDYATKNIRVNSIGPGFIHTPMIAKLEEAALPLHPVGRLGRPEEVAELVLFLSSHRDGFITGSYFAIDGGYLAR